MDTQESRGEMQREKEAKDRTKTEMREMVAAL